VPTAVIDVERLLIPDSLLDEVLPCSHDQPTQCLEPAEWVRVCPRCRRHRFRCEKHHAAELARTPSHELRCGGTNRCPHTATAAELNSTFRPI
jgi:hypothetical protein